MKSSKLAAVVSGLVLLAAGAAQAEGTFKNNGYNHSFMAKRPYQAVVDNAAQTKDAQWEGATLINEVQVDENAVNTHKALRVNMLSKRPY